MDPVLMKKNVGDDVIVSSWKRCLMEPVSVWCLSIVSQTNTVCYDQIETEPVTIQLGSCVTHMK